jgi:hypothetical protein
MKTQPRILSTVLFAALTGLPAAVAGAAEPIPLAMADLSDGSYVGVRLNYRSLEFFGADLDVSTFEVFAEARAGSRVKLFAVVPVAHLSAKNASGDEKSHTALGNVTGGVRFLHRMSSVRQGLSLSLSLPTAEDEDSNAAAPGFAAMANFVHDIGKYMPGATTFRAAGSVRHDVDQAFLQMEVGLDHLRIDDKSGDRDGKSAEDGTATTGRFTLGAGLKVGGGLSVLSDLVTMNYLDLPGTDDDEGNYYHSLETGVRYDTDELGILARVSFPLDEDVRDDLSPALTIEALGRF